MARQTQAERSASTRQALIGATLDLLVERGWAGITSVAVCERAGLTRGAFVHHFDGLPELFAAALDARYADLAVEASVGSPPVSIAELVEQTWRSVAATDFKVVIEAWLAAANDAELRAAIGPVVERFAGLVNRGRRLVVVDDDAKTFVMTAHETILGLALGRATNQGRPVPHEQNVLQYLSRLAREHDARIGLHAQQ